MHRQAVIRALDAALYHHAAHADRLSHRRLARRHFSGRKEQVDIAAQGIGHQADGGAGKYNYEQDQVKPLFTNRMHWIPLLDLEHRRPGVVPRATH